MTGYVYVIGPDKGPFKIGITRNVEKRLAGIQTGNPHRLFVHFIAETDTPEARETALHNALSQYRLHGEWFECEKDMIRRQMVEIGMDPTSAVSIRGVDEISFPPMSASDFCAWIEEMRQWVYGRTDDQLIALLGVEATDFRLMKAQGADCRTALACRALAHNMTPYSADGPRAISEAFNLTPAVTNVRHMRAA